MIVVATLLATCLKVLLIPAYRSTDFEVHRNWLAITHSLPVNKWYFEDTSEWTLDYPPLFAWFEYLLTFPARLFDEKMLDIKNLNYASFNTILYQRMSVIFTDLVYSYGAYRVSKALPNNWRNSAVLPILLIANCGLIMLDHVHFQYNGIMYGILLISIANMFQEKFIQAAFWFTILLNMKHIYIYLAPAYFIFLLKNYCLSSHIKNVSSKNFVIKISKLGVLVLGIFLVTFFPFRDHLQQVLFRLFPFKRGLCHAYWAPNIWALYNIFDKIAFTLLSKIGFNISHESASMTGGLVKEYTHTVFPNVTPLTTMVLTVIMMLPCVLKLWTMRKPVNFLRCMVLCALTSFLFGWHVHEKAILMAIIPLTILAVIELEDARIMLMLSTVGHYSLFPLLFPTNLLFVKLLLFLLYFLYLFYSFGKMYSSKHNKLYALPFLSVGESLYLTGHGGVFLYENIMQYLLGLHIKLPYLPLMATSVYCSIGVVYCWFKYYMYFLRKSELSVGTRNKTS